MRRGHELTGGILEEKNKRSVIGLTFVVAYYAGKFNYLRFLKFAAREATELESCNFKDLNDEETGVKIFELR